jgi:hypothetical protein
MQQKGFFDNDKDIKSKQSKPQQQMMFSQAEMLSGQIKHFDTSNAVTREALVLLQGEPQRDKQTYYAGDLTPYLREVVRRIPSLMSDPVELAHCYTAAREHVTWWVETSANDDLREDAALAMTYILRAIILCEWRTGVDIRALMLQS